MNNRTYTPADRERLYRKAVTQWGISSQLEMLVEECAELIIAIKHLNRERVAIQAVHEEIADVGIMVDEMRAHYPEIAAIEEGKLARLERIIGEAVAIDGQ